MSFLRNPALTFAAGCGGALIKNIVAWTAAHFGIAVLIGTNGGSALQPGVLYPRIVWGGLWGLLFLIPFMRRTFWFGALVAAITVTLLQWLVLPLWWHHGISFAVLPLVNLLLMNIVWAVATAALLKWT